jgi:hypothetical protein
MGYFNPILAWLLHSTAGTCRVTTFWHDPIIGNCHPEWSVPVAWSERVCIPIFVDKRRLCRFSVSSWARRIDIKFRVSHACIFLYPRRYPVDSKYPMLPAFPTILLQVAWHFNCNRYVASWCGTTCWSHRRTTSHLTSAWSCTTQETRSPGFLYWFNGVKLDDGAYEINKLWYWNYIYHI